MTDTTTLAPNYKQLMELHGQGINAIDPVSFARAVLAKWGSPATASGEPVAKVVSWTNGSYSRNYKLEWLRQVEEGALLYTAPPAQEVRVPLSSQECRDMLEEVDPYNFSIDLIRAVEKHHGITAAQKETTC